MALTLKWTQPLTNTDGSVFDAAQYNGYEIAIDGAPVVSVPVAWDADGSYDFEWINAPALSDGAHSAQIRVKHKSGTSSAYSNAATFTVTREPSAPTNFSIA